MNTNDIKFRYRVKNSTGIKTWVTTIDKLETGVYDFTGVEILSRDRYTNLTDKTGKEIYEADWSMPCPSLHQTDRQLNAG